METEVNSWAKFIAQKFDAQIGHIKVDVSRGNLDLADYKGMCGIIQGIYIAKDIMASATKALARNFERMRGLLVIRSGILAFN